MRSKHVANENLPPSNTNLTMQTSNIDGYRLNMIILEYGETIVGNYILFVRASREGGGGVRPAPL